MYPDYLIPQEEFEEILTEMYLIEAIHNHKIVEDINFSKKIYSFYQEVFDRHGIQKADFDSTFAWYQDHPDIMVDVYDRVLEKMARRSDDNDAADPGDGPEDN